MSLARRCRRPEKAMVHRRLPLTCNLQGIMLNTSFPSVTYDPRGVYLPGLLRQDDLTSLAPKLEAARRQVAEVDTARFYSGDPTVATEPLDAHFYELPERMLKALRDLGQASEL